MDVVQLLIPMPNAVLRGPGGSLVIVPAGVNSAGLGRFQVFGRHGGAPGSSQIAAQQIIAGLASDGYGLMSIRELYATQWGGLISLSPEIVVARLQRDLAEGIIFVAFYIPTWDFTRYVVTKAVDVSALLSDGQGSPLTWTPAQRIAAMLRLIPGYMPPAEQGAWDAVLAPRAVALLATMLASLAATREFDGGVIDGILLAAAWMYASWNGLIGLKDFIGAVIGAAGGTSIEAIQDDARMAANALLVLRVSFLTAILSRARDQEKVISLAKAAPAEPVTPMKPARVAKGWVDMPSTAKPLPENMPAAVCLVSAAATGVPFVSNS
jgi:hypothetical protein